MPDFARLRGQVGVAIAEVIWICPSRREKLDVPYFAISGVVLGVGPAPFLGLGKNKLRRHHLLSLLGCVTIGVP